MAFDWTAEPWTSVEQQSFDWRDLVRHPISKLDTDAFTRIRVMLLAAVEGESCAFLEAGARQHPDHRLAINRVCRVEHFERTLLKMRLPPDFSPVEKAIAVEQLAIEIGALIAQRERDPAVAAVYRFLVPEHVDHLYRLSALLDRTEGKDPNNILQSYTDIRPGRSTSDQHRAPEDDLGTPEIPGPPKIGTLLLSTLAVALAADKRDFYAAEGPLLSDPAARMLFAELGAVAEQHLLRAISLVEKPTPWLDQWLVHEALKAWCYHSCRESETDPAQRAVWSRLLDYEAGHIRYVADLIRAEGRDPLAIVPKRLPDPLLFAPQRAWIRTILTQERDLRAAGPRFVPRAEETEAAPASIVWRRRLHALGIPSESVAAGYRWVPGTELTQTGPEETVGAVRETVEQ